MPWVFNNLEKNGFINLDEYHSLKYPGPKIATDEFLDANKDAILRESPTNQYEFGRFYITKWLNIYLLLGVQALLEAILV